MEKNNKPDKLKDFIKNHRNDFDDAEAPADIWSKIDTRIDSVDNKPSSGNTGKGVTMPKWWMAAASVVMLLTIGWLVNERFIMQDKMDEMQAVMVGGREYSQVEHYYVQQINQKKERLSAEVGKNDSLGTTFEEDLKALDTIYKRLKKHLKEGVTNDKVIDAMIINLRMRNDLLDQQIEILEKVKNEKKQEDEIQS